MKLKKPFNQSILPSAVGASSYRFLSIFMAALLFCGMNSQLMAAAAVIPGANNDSNNNAPASGDKFNSESFLKASNPNADDSQHWTLTEEIGAGILGAALLGGAVVGGYKFYQGHQERMIAAQQRDALRNSTDFSGEDSRGLTVGDGGDTDLTVRGNGISTAVDGSTTVETGGGHGNVDPLSPSTDTTPGWRQKVGDSLASFGQGAWRLGQGAYDLVTLKSCWPAKEVPEQPFMKQLDERHQVLSKQQLATEKASRSLGAKVWDILSLKQDALPDHRTEWQKQVQEMARVGQIPSVQATVEQTYNYQQHRIQEDFRKQAVENLNPNSSLGEMFAVLDPEINTALENLLKNKQFAIDPNNEDSSLDLMKAAKLAYFVAKNQDTLHLGHLTVLNHAFQDAADENSPTKEASQALLQKMNDEVEGRWNQDSAAMPREAAQGGVGLA